MPNPIYILAVMTLPIIHALTSLTDQLWRLFFTLLEETTRN